MFARSTAGMPAVAERTRKNIIGGEEKRRKDRKEEKRKDEKGEERKTIKEGRRLEEEKERKREGEGREEKRKDEANRKERRLKKREYRSEEHRAYFGALGLERKEDAVGPVLAHDVLSVEGVEQAEDEPREEADGHESKGVAAHQDPVDLES